MAIELGPFGEHVPGAPRRPGLSLPRGLDLDEVFADSDVSRRDEAAWLISTIVRKMIGRKLDNAKYARLHSKIIGRYVHSRDFSGIRQRLVNLGIIEFDKSYCEGRYSMGYRLAEKWRIQEGATTYLPRSERMIDRLSKNALEMSQVQAIRRIDIHDEIERQLGCLRIDREASLSCVRERSPDNILSQATLTRRIGAPAHVTVGRTGRVTSAFGNLMRIVRQFLRFDGLPLEFVDLRCCQPAMIGNLMVCPSEVRRQIFGGIYADLCFPGFLDDAPHAITPDLADFLHVCGQGKFYDVLTAELKLPEIKKRVMADFLAPKWTYCSEVRNYLCQRWPSVEAFARRAQEVDHRVLICMLQRAESWFVIERALPKVWRQTLAIPLHDAIYVPRGLGRQAMEVVHGELTTINFRIAVMPSDTITDAKKWRPKERPKKTKRRRKGTTLQRPTVVAQTRTPPRRGRSLYVITR